MEAVSLHKYIGELKTGQGLVGYRDLKQKLCNLDYLYNLPFSEEIAEEVFDNYMDVFAKYLDDFFNEPKYTLDDGKHWLPYPEDLSEFIYQCNKHWKMPLIWDENLVKRNFKLYIFES